MQRVYLDQAKWIDFARCRVGHPLGARFSDALTLAQEAVASGRAAFVLSSAHYFETQRRGKWQSRLELAMTMGALSQFRTIAPPQVIVPAEVDAALANEDRLGINLFGVGINHAFGFEVDFGDVKLPADVSVPPGLMSQIEDWRDRMMEFALLASPPVPDEAGRIVLETARKLDAADRKFADGQAALVDNIEAHKLRGRLADVMTATEVVDIIDPLLEGLARRGVDPLTFFDDRDRVHSLLERIPSRWVTRELRRLRHANPQQQWDPHDLNDVNALSIAVPYCDVVVTERQWARRINTSGLADRYATTVIHDLAELTDILIAGAA